MEARRGAVEDEILVNAQARVALDVDLVVLGAIARDVDLEHKIEPFAFGRDDPPRAIVRLDVEDREQIRGEATLVRVEDDELRGEIDLAAGAAEEVVERVERAALGLAVLITLGRVQLEGYARGEHVDHAGALGRGHLGPLLARGSARIVGVKDVAGGEWLDHGGSIAAPVRRQRD